MSAVRRTALLSILAAASLVAIKAIAGAASGSLGLLAEAAHSSVDLVAAILTFFAVRVGERPADDTHPFGHNKAEHLAALAEGAILVVASAWIALEAITRLTGSGHAEPNAAWWTFAVLGVVIVVDISRAVTSARVGKANRSAALMANALHFAGDFAGSIAVFIGLLLVANGVPNADSVAALIVAGLVVVAAARLMRENVSVLMDSAPAGAEQLAREAIERIGPGVEVRRLRIRAAGGRTFADVVVAVEPDAGVARGHAVADEVEEAVTGALGAGDVVVHVEPNDGTASARARASAAALTVPEVREVHNVELVKIADGLELSLHIKLPRDLPIDEAHAAADRAEQAIAEAVPGLTAIHTHIEPLAETFDGEAVAPDQLPATVVALKQAAVEVTGSEPSELALRRTGRGLVALITVAVDSKTTLSEAHSLATKVEETACRLDPSLDEVVVHTEPA
ncbi:MAG: cation diffusion facilitator family transporter [Actinomycetes bacterium]